MKSMCQEARRNSPSVTDCSPASSCMRTTSRIASSSACAEAGVVEPAGGVRLARLQQLGRPQQAADVVGAERRTGALGHSLSSRRVCGACTHENV